MKSSVVAWLKVAVVGIVATLLVSSPSPAEPSDDQSTEDVLYMVDGRQLHGRIISESRIDVVFDVVDRALGVTTRITYSRQDIAKIERGVAVKEVAEPEKPTRRRATPDDEEDAPPRFGRIRPVSDDADVPRLYIVPMKGQLGTDIHPSIYEEVAKDIRIQKPDLIVFVMDCKDKDDLMIPLNEATEQGLFMHHEYREIVNLFRDELAEFPQVMWVEDSVGFSSLVAMAWEDIYMQPTSRLGGLRRISAVAGGWSDKDVAAKMMAAWTGIGRSFLEYGKYDIELAEAMMRPEYMLSASFKGRKVEWSLSDDGEFLVDNDDEETVDFQAKGAEDLLISQGTVENLDDLAFLRGYREYRMVGDKGEKLVEDYKEKWRRTFDQSQEWFKDYFVHLDWASGADELKWLGRAKMDLENIIKAMERYKAVEIRWRTDMGRSKLQLEIQVEQLKERITALKRNQRPGRGSGRGTGRGMSPGG